MIPRTEQVSMVLNAKFEEIHKLSFDRDTTLSIKAGEIVINDKDSKPFAVIAPRNQRWFVLMSIRKIKVNGQKTTFAILRDLDLISGGVCKKTNIFFSEKTGSLLISRNLPVTGEIVIKEKPSAPKVRQHALCPAI